MKLLLKYYFITLKQRYLPNVNGLAVRNIRGVTFVLLKTQNRAFIVKFAIEVLRFPDCNLLYCKIRMNVFIYHDIKSFGYY